MDIIVGISSTDCQHIILYILFILKCYSCALCTMYIVSFLCLIFCLFCFQKTVRGEKIHLVGQREMTGMKYVSLSSATRVIFFSV